MADLFAPQYQEDRIISTLKLMSFIRGIGRSEICESPCFDLWRLWLTALADVRYVNRLVSYHVALGSETEAGLTLKLHADLHDWNLTTFVDPIPDLNLPRQTEFARKECAVLASLSALKANFRHRTLYMRILAHLSKGKAWEVALAICKELQHEYETQSFSYHRLSELLILQSELYANIVKSDRHFGYVQRSLCSSRHSLTSFAQRLLPRRLLRQPVPAIDLRQAVRLPRSRVREAWDLCREDA